MEQLKFLLVKVSVVCLPISVSVASGKMIVLAFVFEVTDIVVGFIDEYPNCKPSYELINICCNVVAIVYIIIKIL